jgi:hypothetical protein
MGATSTLLSLARRYTDTNVMHTAKQLGADTEAVALAASDEHAAARNSNNVVDRSAGVCKASYDAAQRFRSRELLDVRFIVIASHPWRRRLR